MMVLKLTNDSTYSSARWFILSKTPGGKLVNWFIPKYLSKKNGEKINNSFAFWNEIAYNLMNFNSLN